MTKEQKSWIQYGSAVGMLVSGVGLTVAGFLVPPVGVISDTVLWYAAQTMVYAGSVFGVSVYVNERLSQFRRDLKKKAMRKIKEIIIHCSDTPDGEDFCAADIDRWHRERGWACIGYHYVVRLDGTIEKGRDLSRAGAHCAGHNANSIGVCYIGGRSARGVSPVTYYDTRTESQKKALRTLIADLRKRFGANLKVVGHRDYNKGKLCPCFDVSKEKY